MARLKDIVSLRFKPETNWSKQANSQYGYQFANPCEIVGDITCTFENPALYEQMQNWTIAAWMKERIMSADWIKLDGDDPVWVKVTEDQILLAHSTIDGGPDIYTAIRLSKVQVVALLGIVELCAIPPNSVSAGMTTNEERWRWLQEWVLG